MKPVSIHWFRRDLRVFGNPALRRNFQLSDGQVLGLFCFDSKFLSRPDFSTNRFGFFLSTLRELKKELQAQGGDLLVVDAQPDEAFEKLIHYFQSNGKTLERVSWNRDYEPFALQRDTRISALLEKKTVSVITERDHLIIEPNEITKGDGGTGFYQVYTPFSKKWFEHFKTAEVQSRVKAQDGLARYMGKLERGELEKVFKCDWKSETSKATFPFQDSLDTFISKVHSEVTIPIPPAGSLAAFQALKRFAPKVDRYLDQRDIPSVSATSQLSIYFKNGSLVPTQVIQYLGLHSMNGAQKNGPTQFFKEIVWREFYYSILFHKPESEHQAFLAKYENLKWKNSESDFRKWCEGKTGFPIVDAGMRQLEKTGWMHNRVRMIVASFLTKDLLIDWRWGERHFMKYLLDGDLAPNNGGWQWAASTGCDPQPYFRVFNPWLQGEKFDPDGEYIRTYVPELKSISTKALHDSEADRGSYPRPMVDHSVQRNLAIQLFKVE